MNTENEETVVKRQSRRKRAGRILFLIGLSLLLVIIIFSLSISIVSSYSGVEFPMSNYSSIISLIFVLGLLLIIVGLISIVLPEGLSRDGLWVMKLGPFIRIS
jgi:amino acid transporter